MHLVKWTLSCWLMESAFCVRIGLKHKWTLALPSSGFSGLHSAHWDIIYKCIDCCLTQDSTSDNHKKFKLLRCGHLSLIWGWATRALRSSKCNKQPVRCKSAFLFSWSVSWVKPPSGCSSCEAAKANRECICSDALIITSNKLWWVQSCFQDIFCHLVVRCPETRLPI